MPRLPPRLRARLLAIDGVASGESVFSEDAEALWVDAKQMAEAFAPGKVQIRLTRRVIREHRDRLRADPRVELRGQSDWVTVSYARARDHDLVVELAELAAAQYRPGPGVTLRPPPTGADLARRRRWH